MTVYSSANVILRNLTFRNSQQIQIEISCSTNVQVESLQIVVPEDSPNTDGIHVANSQHVVIQKVQSEQVAIAVKMNIPISFLYNL
jgi:polygalacturonase